MLSKLNKSINYLIKNILVSHKKEELEILTAKKGTSIIVENTSIKDIYFILDGKMKVFKNYENGKTLLLQFVNGFSVSGAVEYLLDIEESTGSVEAVSDVYYTKVSYEDVKNRYHQNITFKEALYKDVIKRFRASNNKSMLNLMYSVETRVASYLLSMSDNNNITLGNLQDLSDNIGTSYRHLHRTFQYFENENFIIKKGKTVHIIDMKKLEKLARGNVYEDSYEEQGDS